ncbi:DNA-directed RNA polymerase I subunit RPA135 [Emergomyces africanus]|uniref:DNA-directed RNA polymerase n=1 Tax=Emergomyces africanus TaxID=1955775 RepID=A0A1B7P6Y3_9EURO|nr:DNA-directed RNA polymerase I subunit RPA135 [Emergomyces africanus]
MAPSTDTEWSVEYDTLRRERLFRHPPKDHTAYPSLAASIRPHIDSFNALFDDNKVLEAALKDIGTKSFLDGDVETPEQKQARLEEGRRVPRRNKLSVRITELFLEKAILPASNKFSTRNREIYFRVSGETCNISWQVKGSIRVQGKQRGMEGVGQRTGPSPDYSNRCHLEKCSPEQLVQRKEESEELGGYFIVNGNEKLIRMLIVGRRNFPLAIVRNSFTKRGQTYTKYGIQIRSVRPDQTSQTNVLHYLSDGNVTFRFTWRKNEFLVPVVMILKALVETNDRDIFERLVGREGSKGIQNTFVTDRVELLLRTYKGYGTHGRDDTRAYLGEKFRPVLGMPADMPDVAVGTEFLRKVVLPHLGNQDVTESQDNDKFNLILFMIRKLYTLVAGDCAPDNPDAVSNQEVLLGGFLYGMLLKERLEEWLRAFGPIVRDWSFRNQHAKFSDPRFEKEFLSRIVARTNENIGGALEYFLSTGNLVSPTGLDLQQPSGYTVMAEKINFYRFISHFRMIHRGSFFAQLKTTTVRKLLPESWGFLCPVHTPDGSPCGLLNHLAHKCEIATSNLDVSGVPQVISNLGVTSESSVSLDESVVVQLDGRILGYCSPKQARIISDTLRYWKVEGNESLPLELEIGYVPNSNRGQYPGVYIFSQCARMLRPVKYLPLGKLDYVGPFEQPYMEIACLPSDIMSGVSTHVEFDPTYILSIVANMTPFSDFNQSPRNMYQCQMSKQTMGTPGASIEYRTDNKLYRLQTGQTPIVRTPLYNSYGLDNFPNGTNAVVAVLSYTGYDMDDAMIINKSAHDRGFGWGTIYKTKIYSLDDKESRGRGKARREVNKLFGFAPGGLIKAEWRKALDDDGLPHIGARVTEGSIVAAWHTVRFDPISNSYINIDRQTHFLKYKDTEEGYVDSVRILGSETGSDPCQALSIKYRVPRKPVIGDKFSSRHGQKVYVPNCGPRSTCLSLKPACNPTSSSTLTLSRLE